MYGEKRELITFECSICGASCLVWIDREDMERAKLGLSVEHAFANRKNQTYLTCVERGLLIHGHCRACQKVLALRASNVPTSCQRCGYPIGSPGVCDECFDSLELYGLIQQFVAAHASLCANLESEFYLLVMVFSLADCRERIPGSLSLSEKRSAGLIKQVEMLADLLGYLAPANIQAELKSYPGGSVAGRTALAHTFSPAKIRALRGRSDVARHRHALPHIKGNRNQGFEIAIAALS